MREMRGYDHRNHSYSHSHSSQTGGYEDRRANAGGYEDRRSGGGGGGGGSRGFEVRREPGYEERRGASRSERPVSNSGILS